MKKFSVIIANKHATSISLENEFFEILKIIATKRNISINKLITEIDIKRKDDNLSSAIRIFILEYLISKTESD